MPQGNQLPRRSILLQNPNQRVGGAGKTVLIVLGILGVLGLLCCGGFGLMGWYGFNQAGMVIIEPLKSNPDLVANIGEVKSAKMNLVETSKVQQAEGNPKLLVVDVQGSVGSGQIILEMEQQGGGRNEMKSARLRMADGKEMSILDTVPDFAPPTTTEVTN